MIRRPRRSTQSRSSAASDVYRRRASTLDKEIEATGASKATAESVGKLIADRAKDAKVDAVVFDRGGHLFHGKVKVLADAAREGGLKF